MPKMKTKSGAKKRFKFTASGKVKVAAAGKRHLVVDTLGLVLAVSVTAARLLLLPERQTTTT